MKIVTNLTQQGTAKWLQEEIDNHTFTIEQDGNGYPQMTMVHNGTAAKQYGKVNVIVRNKPDMSGYRLFKCNVHYDFYIRDNWYYKFLTNPARALLDDTLDKLGKAFNEYIDNMDNHL